MATDRMDRLFVRYRELAEMHGNQTMAGDINKTNRAYVEFQNVLADMVATKTVGQLFSLYQDNDRFVQLWAAFHTLELDENRACDKLHELSDLKIPIVSMTAQHTISAWKAGRLRVLSK